MAKKAIALCITTVLVLLLGGCDTPTNNTSKGVSVAVEAPTDAPIVIPTDTPEPTQSAPEPSGGISWEEAAAHSGEVGTVCGPVAGTSYRPDVNGAPTWLNVGANYPNTSRFQIVIWGEDRSNFSTPEDTYRGTYVCATGTIEIFRGVAQMELKSPSSLATQ